MIWKLKEQEQAILK